MKDCYVGMMVIATPEANIQYGVTVEGVVGIVDKIDKRKKVKSIHIRPAGIQTPGEVMDLIIRACPERIITPGITDFFFSNGYWVSPEYFEPYYEESKITVSLSDYIM